MVVVTALGLDVVVIVLEVVFTALELVAEFVHTRKPNTVAHDASVVLLGTVFAALLVEVVVARAVLLEDVAVALLVLLVVADDFVIGLLVDLEALELLLVLVVDTVETTVTTCDC